jgi:glycosyltransferase involved in cell wall biosynthesis
MKILHVILAFYPNQMWGGPPRIALTLGKGLQRRGHQVGVLTSNILDHERRMSTKSIQGEWEGLPVTYLNTIWKGRQANSMGFIFSPDLWRYRHLIQEADLIHIHGYRHFLFLGAILLARYYKKPVVFQPHGTMTGKFGRVELKKLYDGLIGRGLLQSIAQMVSLSQEEDADAGRLGIPSHKITRILNPIDPEECPQFPERYVFRRKWSIESHEKVILFLSRIHEKKGLDLLIQAFAQIQQKDIRLCVVGQDDGFLGEAQRLVAEKHLGNRVLFTGPLYGMEKYEAYRSADVYVLPTRGSEGLPTTVIEACYAGVPVIVTKTTEVANLLHERTGLAVECNADALQKAIETMINDAACLKAYSMQTSQVVRDYFSLNSALDRYETLYARALPCK